MRSVCLRTYRPKFSGYGYGLLEFAKSFKRNGYNFSIEYQLEGVKSSDKDVIIHFGFPHFFRLEPDRINIARVMFESDSVPRLWAEVLNGMDEVWVASRFNVKTFTKGGVSREKIFVIPDMADKRFVLPKGKGGKRRKKIFRFLSVFLDLSLRKGWDVMLEEFINTFGGRRDVEWVVQCSADSSRRFKRHIKSLAKAGTPVGNIRVFGKRPSASEMAVLYHTADCYVLPTRGEGFGRPFLEAASCGLPVIATGWGGQLDFLNKNNSRLLKYRLVKVPAPQALDCYFLAGQKWAEPSGKDLSLALKEALYRPTLDPVNPGSFSRERVMRLVAERLEKVEKGGPSRRSLKPEIIRYDKNWKADFLSPRIFANDLKRYGRKIAVAGTGRNAGWLSEFLISENFNIPFYIDRKAGRFMGRKVYAVDNLPSNLRADLAIISVFPGAFAEWREMLGSRFEILPVIFYRAVSASGF